MGLWLGLLFCFVGLTQGQIVNSGTISWVHFDNITILNPYEEGARTLTLWKMPVKAGWTGLIGLNTYDDSLGYEYQVSFTVGINQLPPSFTSQKVPVVNWNSIFAGSTTQIPAQGGDGDDYWYFLFAAIPDPTWLSPLTIGIYIIEMQEIAENETSSAITLYNSQEFLFKVSANGAPFQFGDTVQITLSRQCSMNTALNVGTIPFASQATAYNQYVFLTANGTDLFYVIQLQEDCSLLTVTIARIPPIVEVSIESSYLILNWTWSSQLMVRVTDPVIGIKVAIEGLDSSQSYLSAFGDNGNFGQQYSYTFQPSVIPEYNQTIWELYTSSLTADNWFFTFSGSPFSSATLLFLPTNDLISFGTPEIVQRDTTNGVCTAQQSTPPVVTYAMPEESSCACLQTSWRNMQLQAAYPAPPLHTDTDNSMMLPSFSSPFAPQDPYGSLLCLVRPPSNSDSMLISLQAPFSESLELSQNNTFFDIPSISSVYGETSTFQDSEYAPVGGVFLQHFVNHSGLIIIETNEDCVLSVAPDDWSWLWVYTPASSNFNLYSANTTNTGWLVLGQTNGNCTLNVTATTATTLALPSATAQALQFVTVNDSSSIALIHITTSTAVAGVSIQFSSAVDYILAQASSIPQIGNTANTFAPPPDTISRVPVSRFASTTIDIPAIAVPSGNVARDFYAIVVMDSISPPQITITASTPIPIIANFTESLGSLTITVPSSDILQIYRIPYAPSLQVVSTEITFQSPISNLDGNNMTECVLFGAGGLQVIPIQYNTIVAGMHVSPSRDYYYTGPNREDFYLFAYPNTPPFSVLIRPIYEQFLCDAVLLCNGNGVCPSNRLTEGCSCLQGTGYGFSSFYCETKDFHLLGIYFVIGVAVFYAIAQIANFMDMRSASKVRPSESEPLNNSLQSNVITSHLINTTLTLDGVELVVGNAQLLKNVNVHMKSGDLTAVIGPSGAGKSTIMKVLSGRVKPTRGNILINGESVSDLSKYRSLIGYVPQDDVMNPLLTVRENISHSALMRLPKDMPHHEKIRLVDAVIDALGLNAKKNIIVRDLGGQSSLSGGQRKRVSIGMELVICPSILLLDEPTSGLDSKTALSLVNLLQNQVSPMGINIIAVLHQPRYEILNACNNIMILAQGELKYFGKPTIVELSSSFPRLQDPAALTTGANIADMLIDYIEEFEWKHNANVMDTSHSSNHVIDLRPRSLPSVFQQLFLLTKRALKQVFRDVRSLLVLYALTILAAILLGALYHNSEFIGPPSEDTIAKCPTGFQFLCAQNQKDTYMVQALLICLSLGLTAGSSSLSTFGGTEKLLYHRECMTGQSNLAYYAAKMIAVIPAQALAPLLFVSIFHLLTQPAIEFWKLYVVALGIYEVCINIAIFASILLADSRALTVSVVSIFIFNLLSGFNPTLTQLHDSLGGFLGTALPALSYGRWAIEAFYLSVIEVYQDIYNINISLTMWDYAWHEHTLSFVMPFVIGFLLRVCSAAALAHKARSK